MPVTDPRSLTFRGRGEPDVIARVIDQVTASLGYECRQDESPPGGLCVHCVCKPGLHAVTVAFPRTLEWQLLPDAGGLTVVLRFLPSRVQGLLLAAFSLLAAAAILGSVLLFEVTPPAERHALALPLALVFLAGVILSGVTVILLGALGGGRVVAALWPPVLAGVEREGGRLEPAGRMVTRRYGRTALLVTALSLALVAWPMWKGWAAIWWRAPAYVRVLALGGFVFLALFGWAVVLMVRLPPITLRGETLLTGLASSGAVLFLLAVPLPVFMNGGDLLKLEQAVPSESAPRVVIAAGEEAASGQVVPFWPPPEARTWARGVILLSGLGVAAAVVLIVRGLVLALQAWQPVAALGKPRRRGIFREAVVDRGNLRRFRRVFVTLWVLTAAFVWAAAALNLLSSFQAVTAVSLHPEFDLPDLSADVLALAFGVPPGGPILGASVRLGWALYGLGIVMLFAVSVGQFLLRHRRDRRRLREATAASSDPRRQRWQDRVDLLCRRASMGPVQLLLRSGEDLSAQAHLAGLVRQERFVELSTGCLDRLRDEEVEALLAHELAHHRRRHCLAVNLLRGLGRLSFVGDAFALAVQGTAWYEHAADAEATGERFGIRRPDLLRAIRQVHYLGSMKGLSAMETPAGLEKEAPAGLGAAPAARATDVNLPPEGPAALPRRGRWCLSGKIFLLQYFAAMESHYWHPEPRERRKRLDAKGPETGAISGKPPGERAVPGDDTTPSG